MDATINRLNAEHTNLSFALTSLQLLKCDSLFVDKILIHSLLLLWQREKKMPGS